MNVTSSRVSQQKKIRLTVELTDVQASLLVGLARHQANEAARLRRFVERINGHAQSTERRVSTWEQITAALAASVQEAQEVE